jgi:hypothetical protein
LNSEKMRQLVREEQPEDRDQIRKVNEAAFGRSDEADLIDGLRLAGCGKSAEFGKERLARRFCVSVQLSPEPLSCGSWPERGGSDRS